MGNSHGSLQLRSGIVKIGNEVLDPLGALPSRLEWYEDKSDGSHLRLGLTKEGMLRFLVMVGFAEFGKDPDSQDDPLDFESADLYHYCTYLTTYKRNENAQWLDDLVGHVTPHDDWRFGGLINMTGYDLASFIKEWVKDTNHQKLSVAEVILMDDKFRELRRHVGVANVFWSHIQLEGFLGWDTVHKNQNSMFTTMQAMHNLDMCSKGPRYCGPLPRRPHECFHWMDFFSLRQACSDFEPKRIVRLISDIGMLVACIDKKGEYLKRSFCILEMYAAALSKAKMHTVLATYQRYDMERILADEDEKPYDGMIDDWAPWIGPVDVAKASTRNAEDKREIDNWISKMQGGFEGLNSIVTSSILNSCVQAEERVPRGSLWGYDSVLPRSVAESKSIALARKYALVGNWNNWNQFMEFTKIQCTLGHHIFYAQAVVPAGMEVVEFQVVCDKDWELRLFPSGIPPHEGDATGNTVLGPSSSSLAHGRNWRLIGFSQEALLEVKMDPTGERSVNWSFRIMD